MSVLWSELGLEPDSAIVRNLWNHEDLGAQVSSYTATVAANDAVMLLVTGRERKAVRYTPVPPADGQEASAAWCGRCAEGKGAAQGKVWSFRGVMSRGGATWIRVAYTNSAEAAGLAELHVNGQTATMVAFPPTGKGGTGAITIEVDLKLGAEENTLTFSAPAAGGPILDSILVLPGRN
jgi:hypothetical protein